MKKRFTIGLNRWNAWWLFLYGFVLISTTTFAQTVESGRYLIDNELKVIVCNRIPSVPSGQNLTKITFDKDYTFFGTVTELKTGSPYQVSSDGTTYTLFFSTLPLVQIKTINQTGISENDAVLTRGTVNLSDPSTALFTANMGIRVRGGFSRTFPKKSYKMELSTDPDGKNALDASLLGMRNDSEWLLLGMWNEPMRTNNVTAHALWLKMHKLYYASKEPDAQATIRTRYCDVFINNSYNGIYAFTEQIDRKQLKLKKTGDNGEIRGELYKADDWSDATLYKGVPPLDATAGETWQGYEMKLPKNPYNWTNLHALTNFVVNASAEDFKARIGEKMQLDNVIDYFLFLNVTAGRDNYGKNLYLARYKEGDPYFFAPWDLDATYGYNWNNTRYDNTTDILTNGLFDRLLSVNPSDYRSRMKSRWFALRQNVLSATSLKGMLTDNKALLTNNGAYIREAIKWSSSMSLGEQDYLNNWIDRRLVFLDQYFAGLTESDAEGTYEGAFETASCTGLRGWVWNKKQPDKPLIVELLTGSSLQTAQVVATVEASVFRQDLKSAEKGNGSHGFSVDLPSALKDNQPHQLWARVQGTAFTLQNSPLSITCSGTGEQPPSQVTGDFEGYLDEASCAVISGWVWDRNQPDKAITIEFLDGISPLAASVVATVEASNFRQDLKDAGKGNGSHGYRFALPEQLKNNQPHQIWARIKGSNFLLHNSPTTVTCAGSGNPTPPANQPPVAPSVSTLSATVNTSYSVTLPPFTDPDQDALTYSLTGNLPNGISFSAGSRVLSGVPTQTGSFPLSYAASDGRSTTSTPVMLVIAASDTPPVQPPTQVTGDFEGYLDEASCAVISGWVWDRNQPNKSLIVEFLDGPNAATATVVATVEAFNFRQDLKDAGKGNGSHGYRFDLPNQLKNNQPHQIWARVKGSSFLLNGSPTTVTCAGSGNPTPPANQPPVAPSVSMLSATVNTNYSVTLPPFTDPDQDALTYSLTGNLPNGISFSAGSRVLSGVPTQTGSFPLSYAASDGRSTSTPVTLVIVASDAPPVQPPTQVTGDFEGYLDEASCALLRGWVWDRNQPNQSLTVEFLDGPNVATASVVTTVEATIYRQDLQEAGKGNGYHAFRFALPDQLKNNQPHQIWARVKGSSFLLNGSPTSVSCAGSGTPTPPTNQPPVAPSVSTLSATVNTSYSVTLPAFTDPDQDALTYSLTGNLPNGISFSAGSRVLSGVPTQTGSFPLSYAASDGRSTTSTPVMLVIVASDTPPVQPPTQVTGDFEGYLDEASCALLRGWVWDRNRPNQSFTIEFLDGPNVATASVVTTVEASIYRQDLQEAGKGNGYHAFRFALPDQLKNGQTHQIWARVKGSTYVLRNSPTAVTCSASGRLSVASEKGEQQEESLVVWPNPTAEKFEVRYQSTENAVIELSVVDPLGRSRFRKAWNGVGLQTQTVVLPEAQGSFWVIVRQAHRVISKKIIIQK